MTDKEKIKKIKKLADAIYYAAFNLITNASRLHKAMDEYHQFIIHECKEEPVSEDLDEAASVFAREDSCSIENPANFYYVVADKARIFKAGAQWKVENLWKPADGDELPEIDREVVVLTQKFPNDAGIMSVAIGHRPNPDGWDGKSIATGKIEHYTPKTYDKGGWNISDIKYWLDVELPKEIEL